MQYDLNSETRELTACGLTCAAVGAHEHRWQIFNDSMPFRCLQLKRNNPSIIFLHGIHAITKLHGVKWLNAEPKGGRDSELVEKMCIGNLREDVQERGKGGSRAKVCAVPRGCAGEREGRRTKVRAVPRGCAGERKGRRAKVRAVLRRCAGERKGRRAKVCAVPRGCAGERKGRRAKVRVVPRGCAGERKGCSLERKKGPKVQSKDVMTER